MTFGRGRSIRHTGRQSNMRLSSVLRVPQAFQQAMRGACRGGSITCPFSKSTVTVSEAEASDPDQVAQAPRWRAAHVRVVTGGRGCLLSLPVPRKDPEFLRVRGRGEAGGDPN